MARSRKLASVQPVSTRAEYPWWLTLAAPNGVFELDYQAIWAQLYAYGRPDRTVDDTRAIGEAFISAKLLFVWVQDGKRFAFLVGSDKPGRCLPQSWIARAEKRGKLPPYPPKDQLEQFLKEPAESPKGDAGKKLACRGKEVVCQEQGTSLLGFGSGFGSGLGTGSECASHTTTPAPSAPGVCERAVAVWNAERGPLPEVQELTPERSRKILARTRADPAFVEKLEAAVRKARAVPFLTGAGERGWRADFDWFISNGTHVISVLEGKYDTEGGLNEVGRRKPSGALHREPNKKYKEPIVFAN